MLNFDYYGMFDYDEAGGDTYQYTSEEFSSLIQGITGNGISANYLNQFEPTSNGLDITIKSGAAFINGRWGYNSAAKTISLSPTTSTTKRIDRIVIELDVASRVIGLNTLVGTATTGTPTAQALSDNQLAICSVLVANGSITTLTDERVFTYSAAEVQKQLNELKANASNHTHGLITHDGKLTNQSNKVMVVDANGSITAYGGTAVRSMIGAEAANTCLPLTGGNMTGDVDFGEGTRGCRWTTANGTKWHLRPYYGGNLFQLTLKPTDGAEYGAFNINASGVMSLYSPLPISSGGTGASDLAGAQKNLIKTQSITEDTDILTLNNGMYHFEGATTIAKNWPYAGTNQRCEVFVGGNRNGSYGYHYVIVIEQYNGLMYMNNFYWDSWRGWHQIFTSDNAIVTANKIETQNAAQSSGWTKMWTDNEGGNIAIGSKSGKEFQMDAYDDTNFRIFSQQSGSVKGLNLNGINGNLSIDGDYYRNGNRVADVQHGTATVGTSGTNITFPRAFAGVPSVCANGSKQASIRVENITKTGCTLVSGESNNTVQWIAAY